MKKILIYGNHNLWQYNFVAEKIASGDNQCVNIVHSLYETDFEEYSIELIKRLIRK